MTLILGEPEARALAAFARRQLRWNSDLAGRIVTSAGAVGVFTVPPQAVMAFVAVPTPSPVDEPLDRIVRLDVLAVELERSGGADLSQLPATAVSPGPAPSLGHLPPAEGWHLPYLAVASDLVPMVDQARAEFDQRAAGRPAREQEQVAEEIWDRPGFGGVPLRALHVARQLGILTADSARVSASTCGAWRRLGTPRGQVFTYAHGANARLALHVVR